MQIEADYAHSEDSLRLPLGLPVGVVDLSQDHPRLVVSGGLSKSHTSTPSVHITSISQVSCEKPLRVSATVILQIEQRSHEVLSYGEMCDNLGTCDVSSPAVTHKHNTTCGYRSDNVLDGEQGRELSRWRLSSLLLPLHSSGMLLRWLMSRHF